MDSKTMVMIGLTIGSLVGGYIPTFFGAGVFSFASLIGSTVGGIVGIYIMYKLTQD
jgi:uncharacterized membrane protein YeaQ/YmgE (transglycosylase-associated protein family)